jgi:hypothetical protein
MDNILSILVDMQKNLPAFLEGHGPSTSGLPSQEGPPLYDFIGHCTEAEARTRGLFPVNHLTDAMIWFLQQRVVGDFLRMELTWKIYRDNPVTKPDPETVLYLFLQVMASKRFQVRNAALIGVYITWPWVIICIYG